MDKQYSRSQSVGQQPRETKVATKSGDKVSLFKDVGAGQTNGLRELSYLISNTN